MDKQAQGFVTAVESIYDAAAAPDRWPSVMQRIADVFDDVGAMIIYARDNGTFGTIVSPSLEAPNIEYAQAWSHRDLRAIRAMEVNFAAGGDLVSDLDLVTPSEMDNHPYYTEFLAKHGLKWFLGTGISPDPRLHVALTVQRSKSKPSFSEAERTLFVKIGRHLEKALRLGIRLIDAEIANESLADSLRRVGIGVFLLDDTRRVVFANAIADRMLGDGLIIANGKLTTQSGNDRGQFEHEVATIGFNRPAMIGDPRPIVIRRSGSESALIAYVLPARSSADAVTNHFLVGARSIVLVFDPQPGEPADPAIVRDLLGLTLGEARVAALVGAGIAPRAAAERLQITEETARGVLKRVFTKVGVSRQSELAALITKLVVR